MTLADVLREMTRKAMEQEGQSMTYPVWRIIALGNELPEDEVLSLRVNEEKRAALVKGEKRMSTSYITNTCNRMRELQDADKSISLRFSVNENGDKILTIRVKSGKMQIGSRGKSEAIAERRAVERLIERVEKMAPCFDDLPMEARGAAVEGASRMKALLKELAGL